MAKLDSDLYRAVRSKGLRKSVARDVAEAARKAGGGKVQTRKRKQAKRGQAAKKAAKTRAKAS